MKKKVVLVKNFLAPHVQFGRMYMSEAGIKLK